MKKIKNIIFVAFSLCILSSCATSKVSYQPEEFLPSQDDTSPAKPHVVTNEELLAMEHDELVGYIDKLQFDYEREKQYLRTKLQDAYNIIGSTPVENLEANDIDNRTSQQITVENINKSIVEVNSDANFHNSVVQYAYLEGLIYNVDLCVTSVTDIVFEGGEKLQQVILGDNVNYFYDFFVSNVNGVDYSHLIVRTMTGNNNHTNGMVVTNYRTYFFRFVSRNSYANMSVSFSYGPNSRKSMSSIPSSITSTPSTFGKVSVNGYVDSVSLAEEISKLNFNYKITGAASWKPERVYSDGVKTYIQFGDNISVNSEQPTLYLRRKGQDEAVECNTTDGKTYIAPMILSTDEAFVLKAGKREIKIILAR